MIPFSMIVHRGGAARSAFYILLHQSEAHPLPFQPLADSLRVYPVWHQERFFLFNSSALHVQLDLTALESALTDERRVLAEIIRNRPPATLVESILTRSAPVTPLSATLTKTRGGGLMLASAPATCSDQSLDWSTLTPRKSGRAPLALSFEGSPASCLNNPSCTAPPATIRLTCTGRRHNVNPTLVGAPGRLPHFLGNPQTDRRIPASSAKF